VTVFLAIPFITFALYVNPILRLFNVLFEALQSAFTAVSGFMARIAVYMRIVLKILARAVVLLFKIVLFFKNIGLLTQLAKLCFCLSVLMVRKWRTVYHWIKDYRMAKKEAKSEGRKWRRRQYFVRKLLERWQRMGKPSNKTKGEGDEEEQRDRDVETEGSSNHATEGSLNREDEHRVEEASEDTIESPRSNIETDVNREVKGETNEPRIIGYI
jgi:hypothetical protein